MGEVTALEENCYPTIAYAINGEIMLLIQELRIGNILPLLDAATALAFQFICFMLLCYSWIRSYQARRRVKL